MGVRGEVIESVARSLKHADGPPLMLLDVKTGVDRGAEVAMGLSVCRGLFVCVYYLTSHWV